VLHGGAEGGEGVEGGGGGIDGDEVGAVGGEALEGVDDGADAGLIGPLGEGRQGEPACVGDHGEGEAGIGEHAEELVVVGAAVGADVHGVPSGRGKKRPSTHGAAGRVLFESARFGGGRKWRRSEGLRAETGGFGIVVIHSRGVRAET
jgi:hypothetical protein